jgi:hypothetical protein
MFAIGVTAAMMLGAPVPAGQYVFVLDTHRWVKVCRRDNKKLYWSLGKLDAAGNFIAEAGCYNLTTEQNAVPPGMVYLNENGMNAVYEYRSGRLIIGKLDQETDNFIPDLGGKVIDFKEYRYGVDVPIWNLPGYFMPKDKFDERRKWLAEHAGDNADLLAEKARLDAAAQRLK